VCGKSLETNDGRPLSPAEIDGFFRFLGFG